MIILMVIVLVPTLLLGQVFGAGAAAIIGGFVALFSLISSMGGPLRANLLRFSFVGPLVAVGSIAPRLLAEVSVIAAIALATIIVFVAGLLPLRSSRYNSTALGLGMGTLLGYAMPVGTTSALGLIAAALAGLVVSGLLLLVMGKKDPSAPTRAAVAGLFDESNVDFAGAFSLWVSDRSPKWLGSTLLAAGRYRLARRVVVSQSGSSDAAAESLDFAAELATHVADAIRAPKSEGAAPTESSPTAAAETTVTDTPAISAMMTALHDAERAAAERDITPTAVSPTLRRTVDGQSVRAGIGQGAIQLRHAIRTAVAVLLAFCVSLFLEPGDPLLPTLLLTTLGVVQASWHATLARALDRFGGILAGGVLVVLVLAFLPPSFLFPISMVGLAVGMWFITARPAIGTAGLIVMSVGLNAEVRNLDPFAVAIEYTILTAIALLIATVIGFAVVPSWRPAAIAVRVSRAIDEVAGVLLALGESPADDRSALRLSAVTNSQVATQQLVPDHEKLTAIQERELAQFREGLKDLLVTSIFLATQSAPDTQHDFSSAARILSGGAVAETERMDVVNLLAWGVASQRARLEATFD